MRSVGSSERKSVWEPERLVKDDLEREERPFSEDGVMTKYEIVKSDYRVCMSCPRFLHPY